MAGFSIYDEEFTKKLDSLAMGFDEIAEESLNKAAPILVEAMKKEASAVIEHDGKDSEMVKSIKAKKAKKAKNGAWMNHVVPTGYSNNTYTVSKGKKARKYKVTNAAKMVWLEYGNRGGRQEGRPFIAKAVNDAESAVLNIIQDELNKKVEE